MPVGFLFSFFSPTDLLYFFLQPISSSDSFSFSIAFIIGRITTALVWQIDSHPFVFTFSCSFVISQIESIHRWSSCGYSEGANKQKSKVNDLSNKRKRRWFNLADDEGAKTSQSSLVLCIQSHFICRVGSEMVINWEVALPPLIWLHGFDFWFSPGGSSLIDASNSSWNSCSNFPNSPSWFLYSFSSGSIEEFNYAQY